MIAFLIIKNIIQFILYKNDVVIYFVVSIGIDLFIFISNKINPEYITAI